MKQIIVGMQMLFVAFGALVLVPLLTGLDPNVALFTAGIGTLLFHLVTKGKVPVFLASSFAYIAPIIAATKLYGIKGTLGGLAAAGLVKILFSAVVKREGMQFVNKYLPAYVIGPVIIVIGLSLAPVAIGMINGGDPELLSVRLTIAATTLTITILMSIYAKGIFKLIPILGGITVGYVMSLFFGLVDFSPIAKASWVAIPDFTMPSFNWKAIAYLVPVAIAPAIEHIGDIMVISNVTGKKFHEDPGLHRTLLGDGIATFAASCFGGPPNTTYSEVTGAVAITKSFNPKIMWIAAVFAIFLSFFGKIGAFLKTIPAPVMGGIMIVLFGTIAAIGIKNMVENKIDVSSNRNLIIVAVILAIGVGGGVLSVGQFKLAGIGLAGVVGVVLNIVLPKPKNDHSDSTEFEDL